MAREYGRLKHRMKEKGRPIPENDIWIASAAICYGVSLATRDTHFPEIDDLETLDWLGVLAELTRATFTALADGRG